MKPGVIIYSGQDYRVFGGGQTTTQLARAFLRRGYEVLFVPIWRYAFAGGDTGPEPEPGVTRVLLEDSTPVVHQFLADHPGSLWLCGVPTQRALHHQDMAREAGAYTIYHIRDDWSAFGESWWEERTEKALAARVDAVTAITPQYDGMAEREVVVVPNAHDPTLWAYRRHTAPGASPIVVYWGSFGRNFWRDDVFREVCDLLPHWRFVLVGGYAEYKWPEPPANVMLAGWQPLAALPFYASQADFGIIPFGTAISHRCDPIKAHEFCAAGLPFVACGCPAVELLGIPGARHVATNGQAVAEALCSLRLSREEAEAQRQYALTDTWDERVDRFLKLAEGSAR